MKIKVYKKEKVSGLVILLNNDIIGMIHSRYNAAYKAFEVKRVASIGSGFGEELYLLLSLFLSGRYLIKDTEFIMPKALEKWEGFRKSSMWEKVTINNTMLFRVKSFSLPKEIEIEYLSFLDVDWFRSINFFKDSMITSIEKYETNPSPPTPLSVVTQILENND